jgi:hypothetical protein
MKLIVVFALLSIFFPGTVFAQTLIFGTVKDRKAQAIYGVNVFVKDSYDGASSDLQGQFKFKTDEKGPQTLVFSIIGYEKKEVQIHLDSASLEINIQLIEAFNQLDAVTITAGALETSDAKKATVLRPIDIVTTAGAMGDVVGTMNTLPGTTTVGNDGRLFVRGGSAGEVRIFIDGLWAESIFQPTVQNLPTRARFSPFLFKGSFFSTGGYSAQYGQALSSALVLNTTNQPARTQGDLNLISVGLGYSQTIVGENSSFSASFDYSNLAPYQSLINQYFDWSKAPESWDALLAFRTKIGKNGLWKNLVILQSSRLGIGQDNIDNPRQKDEVELNNNYLYINSSLRTIAGQKMSFFTGFSFGINQDWRTLNTFQANAENYSYHLKAEGTYDFGERSALKLGVEGFGINYLREFFTERNLPGFQQEFNSFLPAVYLENDHYFSNSWVLRAGLRTELSNTQDKFNVAPRLSLAWRAAPFAQFSMAYGDFYQQAQTDLLLLNDRLPDEKARHYILNFTREKEGRMLRAEIFHKEYLNLTRTFGGEIDAHNWDNSGSGYANGGEVFWRDSRSIKNTDFWLSYSFLDTRRLWLDYPEDAIPGFAAKHSASFVVKHFIPILKSQIGLSHVFNSGLSYSDPNHPGFQNKTAPSFQNLSISWSYLHRSNIIFHVACNNVLGRENIFGYRFSANPNAQGQYASMAIGQPALRFLFAGLFVTLSKDKSANQLNNL